MNVYICVFQLILELLKNNKEESNDFQDHLISFKETNTNHVCKEVSKFNMLVHIHSKTFIKTNQIFIHINILAVRRHLQPHYTTTINLYDMAAVCSLSMQSAVTKKNPKNPKTGLKTRPK